MCGVHMPGSLGEHCEARSIRPALASKRAPHRVTDSSHVYVYVRSSHTHAGCE
jgi:hypothetical protein